MLACWRTLTTGFFVRKKHRVIHRDAGFMTLMTCLMARIFIICDEESYIIY